MGWAVESKPLLVLVGLSLLAATRSFAVEGGDIIDTIAGGGNGDGFPAAVASTDPDGVSVGPDGSIYIAESSQHRIRRIDAQSGFIETVAGIGSQGFAGDGGQAVSARLSYPTGAVADASGNLYICDQSNQRIRRVSPNGIITTVAGSGVAGYADGPAGSAKLYLPRAIAVDPSGNILIAEPYNQRVRYLNVATATVSTVAGNGLSGYNGDEIPATQAKLFVPTGAWALAGGGFLIADQGNNRIRKVDSVGGNIHTVAGTGISGFSGDGGQAKSAKLSSPIAVSARADGTIAIVDVGNQRLRVVNPSGVISTATGTGTAGYNGDSIPGAQAALNNPSDVAFTAQADCLIADLYNKRVRSLDGCTGSGSITTIAGVSQSFTGDGWPALAALFAGPSDAVEDSSGAIFIADSGGNRVRRIRTDGLIETYAGTGQPGFSGDNGPATAAQLSQPYRLAFDPQGNLLVLDSGNRRLRRINVSTRVITTIAGTGGSGSTGDSGPATSATFMYPLGLTVDSTGRIFIADASARRIRMIDATGRISTIAGTGVTTGSIDGPGGNPADDLGDSGPALLATFIAPNALSVDGLGNVYVTDMSAQRIRQIDTAGNIRTIAGTGTGTGRIDGPGGNPADDLGDGGPATSASVNSPAGIDVVPGGDIYIADQVNRRVRVIRNGIISTVSGDGVVTWAVDGEGGDPTDDLGDGGAASRATLNALSSVFMNDEGDLLLTDGQARRLRMIAGSGAPPPTPTNSPPPPLTFTATRIPSSPTPPPATATRTATSTRTNTPGSSSVAVFGHVMYYSNSNLDVPSVDVDLTGPGSTTVRTNTLGDYGATNLPSGIWNVAPGKTGGYGNAISSLDAARVLQVIAGLTTFTPTQTLACDVTGDGTLSALDATRILQFSAGVINQLPVAALCHSDWLFNPISTQGSVVPPDVGGGTCQTGAIVLNMQTGQATNQNFQGILFGDCTGNWTPSGGAALRQLASSGTAVHAGNLRRAPGNRWRLPIYVQSTTPFQALDVTVTYDANALKLEKVDPTGAASEALLGVSNERTGVVSVSLASGNPIPTGGLVLMIEFDGIGSSDSPFVRLSSAEIDEQQARVITHSAQ